MDALNSIAGPGRQHDPVHHQPEHIRLEPQYKTFGDEGARHH